MAVLQKILLPILLLSLVVAGCNVKKVVAEQNVSQAKSGEAPENTFPCLDFDTAAFKKASNERIYGYTADLSLKQATTYFNSQLNCLIGWKDVEKPLTEQEIQAAVADALTNAMAGKKKFSAVAISQLEKVLTTKTISKGMLLFVDMGYESPDYKVSRWQIYLQLEVDKYPNVPTDVLPDLPKTETVILIRQKYVSWNKVTGK